MEEKKEIARKKQDAIKQDREHYLIYVPMEEY